jgi:hypothetical protein
MLTSTSGVVNRTVLHLSVLAALLGSAALCSAATVVPGHSNPYLAGMPDGASDGSDSAPDESPVLVSGLVLTPGAQLSFINAVGGTDRGGDVPPARPTPDATRSTAPRFSTTAATTRTASPQCGHPSVR